MSIKFYFITFLVPYVIRSGETMKIFPLSNEVCLEILQHDGKDTTDATIVSYALDAKSTLQTGQSPNREVFRLFIRYEKDAEIHDTSFLLKAPIASIAYNFMYKYGVYEREYAIYSQVLPQMLKLEDESFSAKFVAGEDMQYISTLILEDLYMLEYKGPDITKPLDIDHCKLVFKTLGRFHALSVILDKRQLIPDIVKNDTKPEDEDDCQDCDAARTYFDRGMNHFVQNLNTEIKEKYSEKLEHIKSNITDKIHEELKDGFKALSHGNLLHSSLLFKYQGNTLQRVKFINFIGARWNTPLVDIFYLAIGCMKFEHVEEHFDSLLEIYSNAMNDLFEKYQVDLYTLDDLKNDIRTKYMNPMWVCGVVLPLLSNPQLPIQVDGYSFKDPLSADNMATAYSNHNYVEIASKWFMFFVNRGIFDE